MKKELACILLLNSVCSYAGTMGDTSYDLQGLQIGLGAGLTTFFDKDTHQMTIEPAIPNNQTLRSTNSAILFEGHAGYGQMWREHFYLGAKGSVYYTPMEYLENKTTMSIQNPILTINNNTNQISLKPIYNIDAVLGYEIYPHFLPFVEGGVSFANVNSYDTQYNNVRADLGSQTGVGYATSLSSEGYKTGYNVGIGSYYQATSNWLFSTELVYNYLGKYSSSSNVALPITGAIQHLSSDRTFQLVSFFGGVSYIFK